MIALLRLNYDRAVARHGLPEPAVRERRAGPARQKCVHVLSTMSRPSASGIAATSIGGSGPPKRRPLRGVDAGREQAAAAALVLLPAAPALADPPWSAPATIAAGIPAVSEPTIGFGASGLAVLSARLSTQADGVPSHGFSRLFGQQPGGSFAGRARIVLAAPPAPYAANRIALLRVPLAEGDRHDRRRFEVPRSSLGYGYGRGGGPLEVSGRGVPGASRRQADKFSGAIAANARGDVIAARGSSICRGRDHLVAAVRRAGGVVRPPGR